MKTSQMRETRIINKVFEQHKRIQAIIDKWQKNDNPMDGSVALNHLSKIKEVLDDRI